MSYMKNIKIYMIGPDIECQGGISSVLKIYKDKMNVNNNMEFISTYLGENKLKDIIIFIKCLAIIVLTNIKNLTNSNVFYHIHTASRGSFIRKSIIVLLCSLFRKKCIIHVHGAEFHKYYNTKNSFKKYLIKSIFKKCETTIVLSKSWACFFMETLGLKNVEILYNPLNNILEKKEYLRKKVVKIVFAGRIGNRKGVYDLINAVNKIEPKNFKLFIFGDGEWNKAKEMVKKMNLENKVEVNSWRKNEEIIKFYFESDIFVLPSYAEGLPMSILEAMGQGLPIVSTNVGGISEAVKNGENGFLIKPGQIDKLSEILKTLINDKELRGEMGARSLEIGKEFFTTEVIYKKLKGIYYNVCKSNTK